jgi:hypothetical protein
MARQHKPARNQTPDLTPEEVLALIVARGEGLWAHQLWHLLLKVPNPIGRMILDVIDCDLQITERLEREVERRTRRPDDPDADQILALKQRMSWEQLARHLSEKERRKVSVNSARQRYYRAKARRGRTGTYAVTARRVTV